MAHATGDDSPRQVRLIQPTPGLHLALDPRIPDELEAFAFQIESASPPLEVEWFVDDVAVGSTSAGERRFLWPLERGTHLAHARVRFIAEAAAVRTPDVLFLVK
jgi:penicillin-binding protein 1C